MGNLIKTVVITGAGKGIGRELSLVFLNAGWNVVAFSRTESDLDSLVEESRQLKGSIHTIIGDATVSGDIKRLVSETTQHFGYADVLVNNAGVFKSIPFLEMTEDFFSDQSKANALSTFLVSQQFGLQMKTRKAGHIINIISVAAKRPFVGSVGYCSAKSAQDGLGKVMREELKPYNIRVTNVYPGAAFTNSWAGSGVDENRLMKASDVAETIFKVVNLDDNMVIEEIVLRPVAGDL
ncbi:MAG: SDR family oxidoreductase [Bacteroidetes bacterium]|nr:SDR family oxidoreductase [Bacteroidota bacterium]